MKTNEELKEVVKKMTWTEPLYPRDSFFGGRTGLTACYYKAKEGRENILQSCHLFVFQGK